MAQTTLTGSAVKKDSTKAHEMATKQKSISVAEFFAKNRHLLGFDNKRKALMTTIKEAVDNSLDACEEARILPEISVEVIDMQNERFRVIVEDNGPGIVEKQIPNIFAQLLYGSKFHRLKQSRGQQGIGISASVMYAQMTTGRPAKIISKIGAKYDTNYFELNLNTKTNKPEILKREKKEWNKEQGTRIELDIEASYQGGSQSIDEYLKETAIANPHVTIIYTNPKAQQIIFPRAIEKIPDESKEIKPHPYGVELGFLANMLADTEAKKLQNFLTTEFSRVSASTAKQICENARLLTNTKPKDMTRELIEDLMKGIKDTKIISPPTDCLSPIGAETLEKGLRKEINAEFFATVTRPPSVYRGNPFVIEAGVAYGGNQEGDKPIRIMRFANTVPLLFQAGACAITKSVTGTSWRSYGLSQSNSAVPVGPCTVVIHMASVWVPFTSESKEALAHYPEIIKEIKLALQECGRKLASYVSKKKRVGDEFKKRSYIEKYIPHVAEALKDLLKLNKGEEEQIKENLKITLESQRGVLKDMKFDEKDNNEFDEEFAKLGTKRADSDLYDDEKSDDTKQEDKDDDSKGGKE